MTRFALLLTLALTVGCGRGGGPTTPLAQEREAVIYSVSPTGTIGRVGDVVTFRADAYLDTWWNMGTRVRFTPSGGATEEKQYFSPDDNVYPNNEITVTLLTAGTFTVFLKAEVPASGPPDDWDRCTYSFTYTVLP